MRLGRAQHRSSLHEVLGPRIRPTARIYPERLHPRRLLQEIGETPSQRAEDLQSGGLRREGASTPHVLLKSIEIFRHLGEVQPTLNLLQPFDESTAKEFFQNPCLHPSTNRRADISARAQVSRRLVHTAPIRQREETHQGPKINANALGPLIVQA